MSTKKRCPFRRQDCTDKCALYSVDARGCYIAHMAIEVQRMAGELYYLAEVAAPQTGQKQEEQA